MINLPKGGKIRQYLFSGLCKLRKQQECSYPILFGPLYETAVEHFKLRYLRAAVVKDDSPFSDSKDKKVINYGRHIF